MSIIKFEDDFDLTPETPKFTATCHFCKKTFKSWDDYNTDKFWLKPKDLPCCEECRTLKPCRVEDHKKWYAVIECGSINFECEDMCSIEDVSRMDGPSACRDSGYDWEDIAMGRLPVSVKYDQGPRDWETGVYDSACFEVTPRDDSND